MYVRIQVHYPSRVTGKPVGVFGGMHHLSRRGLLTPEEADLFEKIDSWFDENLGDPPFYKDGNKQKAVTWFKSSAADMIERVEPLVQILKKYNIRVDKVTTDDPGVIVYEDEYQVGVIDR